MTNNRIRVWVYNTHELSYGHIKLIKSKQSDVNCSSHSITNKWKQNLFLFENTRDEWTNEPNEMASHFGFDNKSVIRLTQTKGQKKMWAHVIYWKILTNRHMLQWDQRYNRKKKIVFLLVQPDSGKQNKKWTTKKRYYRFVVAKNGSRSDFLNGESISREWIWSLPSESLFAWKLSTKNLVSHIQMKTKSYCTSKKRG